MLPVSLRISYAWADHLQQGSSLACVGKWAFCRPVNRREQFRARHYIIDKGLTKLAPFCSWLLASAGGNKTVADPQNVLPTYLAGTASCLRQPV